MRNERIYNAPEGWIIEYPQFSKLADEQAHSFWPWSEPEVENDVQDLRVRMTKPELHGIIQTLKLFTKYEMFLGDDFWSGRVMKNFKRPEIQRMASLFSAVEFNSHAPFYNKINEVLYLDTEEFYSEWKDVEALKKRMEFLRRSIQHEDDLMALPAFTFTEGAVLYSAFAFIKHFQAQECGKDLIKNICRGVNLSVSDENTHAIGSGLLVRALFEERDFKAGDREDLIEAVYKMAQEVYEHECDIIDLLFSKGDIKGITVKQVQGFVKHRINVCLEYMGLNPMYGEDEIDNTIEKWFYKNVASVQFHDFFTGAGSEYTINWKEEKFGGVWE